MLALGIAIVPILLLASFLLIVAGLWVYYDRRDRLWSEKPRRTSLHYCIKCRDIYPATPSKSMAECPSCKRSNPRLQF